MKPTIRNTISTAGLLASMLLLSSTAAGATATLYTKGIFATPEPTNGGPFLNEVSQPGGGIYHGTHFWMAHAGGVVRLDTDPAVPGNATETYAGFFVGITGGQVAADPTHDGFYVADQASKHNAGIVRLSFAANEQVSNPCYVAPSLAGRRPSAVVLGPDGNLYVGFLSSGDIVRLPVGNLPSPPACQVSPVVTIGKSIKGGRVSGLAFVGGDLYVAGKDGLTKIANAAACSGACVSQTVPGSTPNVGHFAIWADGIDTIYYLRDANVMRYTVSSGAHQVFANLGSLPDGTVTGFAFVGGASNLLTQDIYGNLLVGDDTSDGTANASGRVWFIAGGQPPVQ